MKKTFSFTLDEDLINNIKSELKYGSSLSQQIEDYIRAGMSKDKSVDMSMKQLLLRVNALYKEALDTKK